jgi:hypothetical protein
MHRSLFLLFALLGIHVPNPTFAVVYNVPSDATPTIASALAIALDGDTIEVAPGTYFESNLHMTRGITLRGIAGASSTTIDAQGVGSVVLMESASPATIEGFTITGGVAQSFEAGGITAFSSSATIRGCVITGNASDGEGGGILQGGVTLVEDCLIEGNTAWFGGGICSYLFGEMQVSETVIRNNEAGFGGGVALYEAGLFQMMDCIVEQNAAEKDGGGVFVVASSNQLRQCKFIGNVALGKGGGVAGDGAEIEDCVFRANRAAVGGGTHISGKILRCTFVENEAPLGGAILGRGGQITRCIIAYSTIGGGMACATGPNPIVTCSDIFANVGGDAICGADGGGNFSLDPLFCDLQAGDFGLYGWSPCISVNHPTDFPCGGDIGAFGIGCGFPTDVGEPELRTWGRLKSYYR